MTTASTAASQSVEVQDSPAKYEHEGLMAVEYPLGKESHGEAAGLVEQAMLKFKEANDVGLLFDRQVHRVTGSGNHRNVHITITFRYVRSADLADYAAALQGVSPSLLLRLLLGS